jgi:hypothetical protein
VVEVPVVVKSKISEESKIMELNEKIDVVTRWLGMIDVEYNLVYRGTQHGFTLPAWYKKLEGKSNLLFIV